MAPAAMAMILSNGTPTLAQTSCAQAWISSKSQKLLLAVPKTLPLCQISVLGRKNRAILSGRVIVAAQSSSTQSETSVDADEAKDRTRRCLEDLAETLILPPDFLSNLPDGLKVELNDAAFALSSGPLNQECGEIVGNLVMGLSRALEKGDTQSAAALASQVPSIPDNLPSDPFSNGALGKRLQAAGRYLASTGQYGDGELQKLSKALLAAGEALSLNSPNLGDKVPPKDSTRMFKFGDLQVKLTAQKAYIGAATAFVFGVVCWNFASGLSDSAVDPSQYANDQSFAVASSLRGALLTASYFCTALSAISMAGLLALAAQLGPEDTS